MMRMRKTRMLKTFRLLLATVLLLSILFTFAGCGGRKVDDALVGRWKSTSPLGEVWEFCSDGTFTASRYSGQEFTYEAEDGRLVLHTFYGEETVYSYMIGTYDGKECIILNRREYLVRIG